MVLVVVFVFVEFGVEIDVVELLFGVDVRVFDVSVVEVVVEVFLDDLFDLYVVNSSVEMVSIFYLVRSCIFFFGEFWLDYLFILLG